MSPRKPEYSPNCNKCICIPLRQAFRAIFHRIIIRHNCDPADLTSRISAARATFCDIQAEQNMDDQVCVRKHFWNTRAWKVRRAHHRAGESAYVMFVFFLRQIQILSRPFQFLRLSFLYMASPPTFITHTRSSIRRSDFATT